MFRFVTLEPEATSWDARLAAAVGRNVQRVRREQKPSLSALALSERTRALGHPVHRSVIAKLESGHRASITLGDLLVLAAALGVPPFSLIAPLELADDVEILPGEKYSSWRALDWFSGTAVPRALAGDDLRAWDNATENYRLRKAYLETLETLRDAHRMAERDDMSPTDKRRISESMTGPTQRMLSLLMEQLAARGVRIPEFGDGDE